MNPSRAIQFAVKYRDTICPVSSRPLSLDAIQELADAAYENTGHAATSLLGHHRVRREYIALHGGVIELNEDSIPFHADASLPDDVLYAVVKS